MQTLLQINMGATDNTLPGLLIIAITGCVAAIVAMAVYIKWLHKKHVEISSAAATLTIAIENLSKAVEKNADAQNDFHKFILDKLLH